MSSNTKIRSAKELQNILRDSEEEVLAKIGLSHLLPGQSSISFALPFWMTTVTIQMKATTLLLTAIPFTTNILNILPCKRHCKTIFAIILQNSPKMSPVQNRTVFG
ncbi:Hypothetical predicted protein [Cloeon dipterum]|uniref:Uncharacterized protein n=1 Tax=Cloeon dipterum TaxID=197152 RepID=A0A8S1DXM0_9INSE|nr:Hypothetical predicted protein [Cloeon dipterum]